MEPRIANSDYLSDFAVCYKDQKVSSQLFGPAEDLLGAETRKNHDDVFLVL